MALEFWSLHWFPFLRFSFLRHRQRPDFLLQHHHDNAVDYHFLGVDLWMARYLLAILRAI